MFFFLIFFFIFLFFKKKKKKKKRKAKRKKKIEGPAWHEVNAKVRFGKKKEKREKIKEEKNLMSSYTENPQGRCRQKERFRMNSHYFDVTS